MKNKKYTFFALIFGTGFAMVAADLLILLFFGSSFSSLRFRFGIPALIFLVLYCVILGRGSKYFDYEYFTKLEGEQYLIWLKKIGAVPIKRIALNVVTHAIFLGIIFINESYLGVDHSIRGTLFLASLAFGMLVGTFIYVAGDGLVSRTLLAHDFTAYPSDCREKRQEAKACIIPLAAVLMTLCFTCSVTLLSIQRAGGTLDSLEGKSFSSMLLLLGIFFIFIIALTLTLKKNTGVLYNSVVAQLENLSSEQKDLTKRISICSVDELGTIAGMVNVFSEHLRGGIGDIKDGQKDLSGVGNRLEGNASGMADSVTRISSAAEQVLAKTQAQKGSTQNSSIAIQRIAEHTKALEESILTQTSSMTQASASVEQMIGNISSIGSVTEKMAAQFKTVGEAASEGSRVQKQSEERIIEIVQQSQALQEANKIIATIAASTNLLSMNAAIEAAHAGEAGKGFSVVADEIRKLAVNSSNESRKISIELKQIIQTIDHIVKDSEASMSAFAEVSNKIGETEKLVLEVNNAVHEQETGAGQVLEALRVMNNVTAKVKDGSSEINQNNEAMIREIDTLQNSAGEILTNMQDMSDGIKNINTSAQEVSHLAAATHASIEKISVIANGFEV
ncbi:MAG: methyl-accepting chemotaxis protein [Treponema sp.]|jgi:methyl-accepting chemotaxis protein|nr:methyl-accepting chemotaxis protein [Treponema sp.]